MKSLVPEGIAPPFGRYAHGVELPPGARIVRTSGQLGQRTDGTVPQGAEAQAQVCFENIRHILAEADMAPQHICHISAFVTEREHMRAYMEARDAFLKDSEVLPTSTLLIVTGFTRPEFLVEVEVWAAKA